MEAYAQSGPPTISCEDDGDIFDTGRSSDGLRDDRWQLLLNDTYRFSFPNQGERQDIPTTGTWDPTYLVTNPTPVWHNPGLLNVRWIAHSDSGEHSFNPPFLDAFYRYQFYFDERVDIDQLNMNMHFWADNAVYDVWVNGQQQGIRNYTFGNPYDIPGFVSGAAAAGILGGPWYKGPGQLNEIVVHVKSFHSHQGFLAQFQPPLCPTGSLTLVKDVINDDGGTATADQVTLKAEGTLATLEGVSGSPQVTEIEVPRGEYTLSETGLAGYGSSLFVCTINGVAQPPGNTVRIENHDDAVVCTVTNNDIKVAKALVEESGLVANAAERDEILTYEVTLTNEEQGPALYDLVDQPDSATTYVSGSTVGAGEPEGTSPLVWRDIPVPPGGQTTIRYQVRVNDLPEGREQLVNCAATSCVEIGVGGKIEIQKTLLDDKGGIYDGLGEPGETLLYEIQLKNVGKAPTVYTLADAANPYVSYVPGSTKGTAGAGEPEGHSPLVWRNLVIQAGTTVTVVYEMLVGDIPETVKELKNIAYDPERYKSNDGSYSPPPPDFCLTFPSNCAVIGVMDVTLMKQAITPQIVRGQAVTFVISLKNNTNITLTNVNVKDVFPVGFRYIDGSASLDGVAVAAEPDGRVLNFYIDELEPGVERQITLSLQALASLKPGEHINIAEARDAAGRRIAAEAKGMVAVMDESQFDCSEILGTVFDDENRNGYQDDTEIGVPGVRVTATSGLSVTTDSRGRFHVPCAELPRERIGGNFMLKLDARSLPTGYRILSENPRAIRLTVGKTSHLNFATSVARVVRLDLNEQAFFPGSTDLRTEWHQQMGELIRLLESEPSVLRMAYFGTDQGIAKQRVRSLEKLISSRWEEKQPRYRLEIETRIVAIDGSSEHMPGSMDDAMVVSIVVDGWTD